MFTVVQVFFDLWCEGSRGNELLCCEDIIESIVINTVDGQQVELNCMDSILIKVAEVEYDDVDNEKVIKDELNLIYDECNSIVDCDIIKLGDVLYSTIMLGDKLVMKNQETGESKSSDLKEIESMLSDETVLISLYRNRKL